MGTFLSDIVLQGLSFVAENERSTSASARRSAASLYPPFGTGRGFMGRGAQDKLGGVTRKCTFLTPTR